MSTDLSGSRAISAMQSPSRIVFRGSSFAFLGLVRGRERPRLSVTGTIMFMAWCPLCSSLDESGRTRGQGGVNDPRFCADENKRNPAGVETQDIESEANVGTQSLVV